MCEAGRHVEDEAFLESERAGLQIGTKLFEVLAFSEQTGVFHELSDVGTKKLFKSVREILLALASKVFSGKSTTTKKVYAPNVAGAKTAVSTGVELDVGTSSIKPL